MALRRTDVRGGEPANGEEVTRRMDSGGVDVEDEDGERECAPGVLIVRVIGVLETILDLGEVGGERDARGPRGVGEAARTACEVEVAWCLNVGGDVAIAFAFARLAAIAAATLVFLVFLGVVGGRMADAANGSGQTFSSCFRARESRVPRIANPRSCHTDSKTQKQTRACSLTPMLASAKDLFMHFSKISAPPDDSIMFLDRVP